MSYGLEFVVTIHSLHHFPEGINILRRGIGRYLNALGFKASQEDIYKKEKQCG